MRVNRQKKTTTVMLVVGGKDIKDVPISFNAGQRDPATAVAAMSMPTTA